LKLVLRQEILPSDPPAIREIVASTGVFCDHEIDVAVELASQRLQRGPASGYFFVLAAAEERLAGYSCYGPIPCTLQSYDVYWIAVHRHFQGRGLGRRLLAESECRIAAVGGRRIYVETSSQDRYRPTRTFYEHCGYRPVATLEDFYAPGDAKMIYLKTF